MAFILAAIAIVAVVVILGALLASNDDATKNFGSSPVGSPDGGLAAAGADAGTTSGDGGVGAPTHCPPTCKITSETFATSPSNRARTKVGVGEEVNLTFSLGSASWTTTGGRLSPSSGATVTFAAPDRATTITITATGSGCTCTFVLTVVEPSNWTMKRKSGTKLRHGAGRPDCGWRGTSFFHPNDVNFYNVEFREKDSKYVGTGAYSSYTGSYHGGYPPPDRVSEWIPIISHTDGGGSEGAGTDSVDTGDPGAAVTGAAPPFNVGSGYFPITIQWRVVGSASVHDFAAVRQEDEIFANGRCESRKGGNTEHTMYNDPPSTP